MRFSGKIPGGHSNLFSCVFATQVSKSRVYGADFPLKMRGLGNENLENLRLETEI